MICLLVLGTLGCGSDADKATAEYNKAKQFYQRGEREAAIVCLDKAIRLDPLRAGPIHLDTHTHRSLESI